MHNLVPQAVVTAAAASAALTAARLGASPLAVAEAVAEAVDNLWRWSRPDVAAAAPTHEVTTEDDDLRFWYGAQEEVPDLAEEEEGLAS